jgi:hypothetical protein
MQLSEHNSTEPAHLKSLQHDQFQQNYGLGADHSGLPQQEAGSSNKPMEKDRLLYAAFKIGGVHLATIKFLEVPGGS